MMNEDLKIRLLLRYEDRFESPAMMGLRRVLASRLLSTGTYRRGAVMADTVYEVCGDEIPDFFESLATIHRRGHIDTELAWGQFDYWTRRYWAGLQSFVNKDRAETGSDVWRGFQELVTAFEAYECKHGTVKPIDDAAVEKFLKQEQQVGN
jgi:hypothetical protein